MGSRPLRQHYDPVTIEIDRQLRADPKAWTRHRRRFVDELGALDDGQWKELTRCDAWDARGVIAHLIVVDQFWALTLGAAQRRDEPTKFIQGFDPATGTDALVAPILDLPPAAVLEQCAAGTDAFVALVEAFSADDWDARAEGPFGHLPAHLLLAHAYWDSWLHERDILEPLGLAPAPDPDDVLNAAVYAFVVGGLQGGLLGDPTPTGPGPAAAIDARVRFDDLATAIHVRYDEGMHLGVADPGDAVDGGDAVTFAESLAGRGPARPTGLLPADLDDQLARGAQIF